MVAPRTTHAWGELAAEIRAGCRPVVTERRLGVVKSSLTTAGARCPRGADRDTHGVRDSSRSRPSEADAPLVVDADAVGVGAVAFEFLQPVARRGNDGQIWPRVMISAGPTSSRAVRRGGRRLASRSPNRAR